MGRCSSSSETSGGCQGEDHHQKEAKINGLLRRLGTVRVCPRCQESVMFEKVSLEDCYGIAVGGEDEMIARIDEANEYVYNHDELDDFDYSEG